MGVSVRVGGGWWCGWVRNDVDVWVGSFPLQRI